MTRLPRRHKTTEQILREETRPLQLQRRVPPTDQLGTPGTDFGTPIVPRTTIPAATRTVNLGGSDTFTPGEGTAYLFRRDTDTGDISPWYDRDSNVIWKTVYNYSSIRYEPNAAQAPVLNSMDGGTLNLMRGSNWEQMLQSVSTDFLGPDTAVPVAMMDRRGDLNIPPLQQQTTSVPQVRVERGIVVDDLIQPRTVGQFALLVDQQIDNNPASAGSSSIVLTGTVTTDDFYNGWRIWIMSGTGEGQVRWIYDYEGSTRRAWIGDIHGQTHNWDTTPDTSSVYKLEKPVVNRGHWWHGSSFRVLRKHEEIWVQSIPLSGDYEILRGSDKHLQRAVVDEDPGIQSGDEGFVILQDSGQLVRAVWNFATASKHIKRLAQVGVAYEDTVTGYLAGSDGKRYRIWAVDCAQLVDSPGDL